jgi:hypothetical protein
MRAAGGAAGDVGFVLSVPQHSVRKRAYWKNRIPDVLSALPGVDGHW